MNTAFFYDGPNHVHDEIVTIKDVNTIYVDCNPNFRFLLLDYVLPKSIKFGFTPKTRKITIEQIRKLGFKLIRIGIKKQVVEDIMSQWCTSDHGSVRLSCANPANYERIYARLLNLIES